MEAHATVAPLAGTTHCLGETAWIKIRMVMSERGFRVAKQILAVKERNGALDRRFGPQRFG